MLVYVVARSMTSKGLLNYTYNWGYHYYRLTNAGIDWIKEQFGITDRVVPVTHVKNTRAAARKQHQEGEEEDGDAQPARTAMRGGRGKARGGY